MSFKNFASSEKGSKFLGLDHLCWCGQTCPFPSTTGTQQSTAAAPGQPHECQEEATSVQTPRELASLHGSLELLYRFLPFPVGFTIILSLFSWAHTVTCHLGRKGCDVIFPLFLKPCSHLGKDVSGISCLSLFPCVLWVPAILCLAVIYCYFLLFRLLVDCFFHLYLFMFCSLLVERDWLELKEDYSF